MAFRSYLEDEDDKPYYHLRTLAYYYEDMERKERLVKELAEKITGYDQKLNSNIEEVEKRISAKLDEWDQNIQAFPERVTDLLQQWTVDGTIDQVIQTALIDEKIQPLTEQLTKKVSVKIFETMPTASQLSVGELGLFLLPLAPIFPFNYLFDGVNGTSWDTTKFETFKFEEFTDTSVIEQTYAKIQDNKGQIKVTKTAPAGFVTVENKSLVDLDFTNGKKYRIRVDMMRGTINGTNKGHCGISLSPDVAQSYYPIVNNKMSDNVFSVYFANASPDNLVKTRVRKKVNKAMELDQFLATGGGYAALSEDRLALTEGVMNSIDLTISATTLKLSINGVDYINANETLEILNSTRCKLILWGSINDLNALTFDHYFDNLIIDEVI